MGRSPCCAKEGLNRGAWTAMEDKILTDYIKDNGEGKWRNLPIKAGLKRCGKSCRLRWLNYLKPDIKRGNISRDEEDLIIRLHKLLGNRWSLIAGRLPGRTDNEIKNYWNTNIGKRINNNSQAAPILTEEEEEEGEEEKGRRGRVHYQDHQSHHQRRHPTSLTTPKRGRKTSIQVDHMKMKKATISNNSKPKKHSSSSSVVKVLTKPLSSTITTTTTTGGPPTPPPVLHGRPSHCQNNSNNNNNVIRTKATRCTKVLFSQSLLPHFNKNDKIDHLQGLEAEASTVSTYNNNKSTTTTTTTTTTAAAGDHHHHHHHDGNNIININVDSSLFVGDGNDDIDADLMMNMGDVELDDHFLSDIIQAAENDFSSMTFGVNHHDHDDDYQYQYCQQQQEEQETIDQTTKGQLIQEEEQQQQQEVVVEEDRPDIDQYYYDFSSTTSNNMVGLLFNQPHDDLDHDPNNMEPAADLIDCNWIANFLGLEPN